MHQDVSIILVNYHTSRLLTECLESLFEKTVSVQFEIVIVDNDSEKDLQAKIEHALPSAKSLQIRYLYLSENIGFGRANNEGVKIAQGRNIFFLNPDTVLKNNAVAILSGFLDQHPEAGACGGNLYDAHNHLTFSHRKVAPGIFWELDELFNTIPQRFLYGENRIYNTSSKPMEVAYITGADLMVKKEVLTETGGFHPDFFMYFEETDLCARIRKKAWKIYNVPQAKIIHLEGGSFEKKSNYPNEFKVKNLENGRRIYYRNNVPSLTRKLSDIIYKLYLNSRILLLKDKEKKSYYLMRKNHFKNNDIA